MDIIFIERSGGKAKTLSLHGRRAIRALVFTFLVIGGVLAATFYLGMKWNTSGTDPLPEEVLSAWEEKLNSQQEQIASYRENTDQQVDALTIRMGQLQARLLRLDAMGARITEGAGFDAGEFDFENLPALGGPEDGHSPSFSVTELTSVLDSLERQAESREQQLRILDEIFVDKELHDERFIAGRPVRSGWLSSKYGYRLDPFTGKRAWHNGVDFAGKDNSEIIAVAGGVVTFAGNRRGYGLLVEISHGNGLVTRYAHCKRVLAEVGDVVKKGQTIARMGSSGRSTGPHVHFEVIKSGRSANPAKFIARARP